jgi:WD40 repeat protein
VKIGCTSRFRVSGTSLLSDCEVPQLSTDLYGVRVLALEPERRKVTFEVFVVYYDTHARTYPPLPSEPGFFLNVLWEQGRWEHPLGEAITVDQILNEEWVNIHSRWFVEKVERTSTANYPPRDEDFERFHDFYYERSAGWKDEELLVQAEYDVQVTDPRWLEQLSVGDAWGTATYSMAADDVRREEAPYVPDLRNTVTLMPFEGMSEEAGTPGGLAFSDDGRYLAVASDEDGLVIYKTDDWTEYTADVDDVRIGLFPQLTWVPGEHVVALTESDGHGQWAYDVAERACVDVPRQPGKARSRTARYRVGYGEGYWLDEFVGDSGRAEGVVPVGADDPEFTVESAAFTADESRLFVAGMGANIHVLDPSTVSIVDTIVDVGDRVHGLAVSPDGGYVAATVDTNRYHEPNESELCVWRVADHKIVTRRRGGIYGGPLAWSPDGRWLAANVTTGDDGYGGETRIFPIGLPADPPAGLFG